MNGSQELKNQNTVLDVKDMIGMKIRRKRKMFETRKCNKCKGETDSFDYRWNKGLCNSCKSRRTFMICSILFVIGAVIGMVIAGINFDYQLDKCSDLKSSESSYDFDIKLETNANYNSNCYYLKKHPLAFISYIFGGIAFGGMLGILIGTMINLMGVIGGSTRTSLI